MTCVRSFLPHVPPPLRKKLFQREIKYYKETAHEVPMFNLHDVMSNLFYIWKLEIVTLTQKQATLCTEKQ